MQIYGKVKRQTEKAILFAIYDNTNQLPEAFHGKELWFPLSQCLGGAQRHTDGICGDAMFAPYFISVPDSFMLVKATEVGCSGDELEKFTAEVADRHARAKELDSQERERKALRRAAKAARTPEQIDAEMAAKEAKIAANRIAFEKAAAERKTREEREARERATWDAMDEAARCEVYRRAGLPIGKKGPCWLDNASSFGGRFHKALAKVVANA